MISVTLHSPKQTIHARFTGENCDYLRVGNGWMPTGVQSPAEWADLHLAEGERAVVTLTGSWGVRHVSVVGTHKAPGDTLRGQYASIRGNVSRKFKLAPKAVDDLVRAHLIKRFGKVERFPPEAWLWGLRAVTMDLVDRMPSRDTRQHSSRDCGCARCASRSRRSSRDHLPTLPGGANRYRVLVDGAPTDREYRTFDSATSAAKKLAARPGYRGSNVRVEEWQYKDSDRALSTLMKRKLVWPYARDARPSRRR